MNATVTVGLRSRSADGLGYWPVYKTNEAYSDIDDDYLVGPSEVPITCSVGKMLSLLQDAKEGKPISYDGTRIHMTPDVAITSLENLRRLIVKRKSEDFVRVGGDIRRVKKRMLQLEPMKGKAEIIDVSDAAPVEWKYGMPLKVGGVTHVVIEVADNGIACKKGETLVIVPFDQIGEH